MAKPFSLALGKLAQSDVAESSSDVVAVSDPKENTRLEEAATKRCLVYCRLRPEKPHDWEDGGCRLLTLSKRLVKVKDDKEYEFDGTFSSDSNQKDIFDTVAKPCVLHALNGYRAAIMAYGQTGTGKTFTLCNSTPGHEGIVPRAAQMLFDHIEGDPTRDYEVEGQFIQIYRDNLGDLMTETGRDRVDIYFDKDQGVTLPGCSSHILRSTADFMKLFTEGNSRRVTTATAMNPESSRGHSALVIWISSKPKNADATSSERVGKITFIDLAGYERFSKTGISNSNAIMKDEAKTINASLLSLGHVVTSLSNNDKHIPWRNAKLTRLLQDSIGGRSRTTIVLTVGPSSNHLFESTNTLQFGQRAMAVKVQAKVTEVTDYTKLAAHLQSLLDEKQLRIDSLEGQVAAFSEQQDDLRRRHERDLAALSSQHTSELRSLRESGVNDEKLQSILRQHDVELEVLRQQQKEEIGYETEAYEKQTLALVEEELHSADVRAANVAITHLERIKELESQLQAAEDEIDRLRQSLGLAPLEQGEAEGVPQRRTPNASFARGDTSIDATPSWMNELESLSKEELLARLVSVQEQLDVKHTVLVETQVQLDRMTEAHRDRGVEIESLRNKGCSSNDVPLLSARGPKKVVMIDAQELEALRSVKDAEIEQHLATIDSLRQELSQLQLSTSSSPQQAQGDSALSPPPLSARIGTARGRRGTTIGAHSEVLSLQNNMLKARVEELENELAEAARLLAEVGTNVSGHRTAALDGDPDDALVIDELERRLEATEAELSATREDLERHRLSDGERASRHAALLSEAGAAFEKAELLAAQWQSSQVELANARDFILQLQAKADDAAEASTLATRRLADAEKRIGDLEFQLEAARSNASNETALSAAIGQERADRVREVETLASKLAAAEVSAAEARKEAAKAKQLTDEKTREIVTLNFQIDGLKADVESVTLDATQRAQNDKNEKGRLRDALRAAEERANEAVAAAFASAARAQALESEVINLKQAALDQKHAWDRTLILEVESAVENQVRSLVTERDAVREELNALKANQSVVTAPANDTGSVAFKMAELQTKLAVATKQAEQHKDEWSAASARAKDFEQKLAVAHEQHQQAQRALGADRDRAVIQLSEKQAEIAALTLLVSEERARANELLGEVDKERGEAASTVARGAAQRNHAVVDRTINIMNEQHQALLNELQSALFASRSGAADAASVLAERKVLLNMLRSSRAKYTQLQGHTAQLCGHIAECHSVMRAQSAGRLGEDLTLRLSTRPGGDVMAVKDIAAIVAQRDEELHAKDQLVVDLTVELETARAALMAAPENGITSPRPATDAPAHMEASPTAVRGASAIGASQHGVVGFLEGEQYRDHMTNIERSLRRRADENNRLLMTVQILRAQLEKLGIAPASDTLVADKTQGTSAATGQITREQLAVETSIDTTDLQILIDCKEAELRVVSYRLEQRERALAALTDHLQKLRAELRGSLTAINAGSSDSGSDRGGSAPQTPRLLPVIPKGEGQRETMMAAIRAIDAMEPESLSREQLEGMLSVMKALRKQNGILHVLLCERGSLLRHFAWLLVHHGILPVNASTVTATTGDQASELRTAFAERDEELYMKDRALLERSSQVILLEAACRELYSQLDAHHIPPAKSVIEVTQSVVDGQRQTQQRMLGREQSRARLHERHVALMQEMEELDGMLVAVACTQSELESELRRNPDDAELKAHLVEIALDVTELRVKKDKLADQIAIVDSQCSSHENEVHLLRQVLANQARMIVDLQTSLQKAGGTASSAAEHQRHAEQRLAAASVGRGTASAAAPAPASQPKQEETSVGFFARLKAKIK